MLKPVSVAFLPVYQNPYQQLLTNALSLQGVNTLHLHAMPESKWLHENQKRVHILHFHWLSGLYMNRFLTPISLTTFLLRINQAQQMGYKIIWTAHNILPHELPFPPMHRFVREFVMRKANAVITHCEYGKSQLLYRFPRTKRVFVIPHGNYDGIHPITKSQAQARSALEIMSRNFVYLLIGNISPYKGVDTFIDAFQDSADPEDVVIIAGRNRAPKLVAHLEELAATDQRIRIFPGFIPEDKMQLYLQAADVAFFAFDEILTSGTVILALTHGLPVVAPAMGCLPELINSNAGLLYSQGQPDAIRKAIKEIKNMDLPSMRQAARQIADQLRWSDIAEQTINVYRSCFDQL
jgi:glycosyltransferase involved in cell wall biosynthesis